MPQVQVRAVVQGRPRTREAEISLCAVRYRDHIADWNEKEDQGIEIVKRTKKENIVNG